MKPYFVPGGARQHASHHISDCSTQHKEHKETLELIKIFSRKPCLITLYLIKTLCRLKQTTGVS